MVCFGFPVGVPKGGKQKKPSAKTEDTYLKISRLSMLTDFLLFA